MVGFFVLKGHFLTNLLAVHIIFDFSVRLFIAI